MRVAMHHDATPFHVARSIPTLRLAVYLMGAPALVTALWLFLPPIPWLRGWLLPIGGAAANLLIVMGFGLRAIKKAFAREEGKLATLLNSVPEGVLEVAKDGTILYANDELCRVFGYDREELIGQSVEMLVPADVRVAHSKERSRFLANGKSRTMGRGLELFGLRKDGARIRVDISLSSIRTGRLPVTYCLIRDLTASKAHERDLLEANRELSRSMAKMERNAAELQQLTKMGELLHSSISETELLGIVAHAVQRLFPGMSGGIYELKSSRRGTAEVITTWGKESGLLRPVIAQEDCWALRCSGPHAAIADDDEPRCLHYCDGGRHPGRCAPLMGHGELIGVLHIFADGTAQADELADPTHAELIQALANQVALSSANLRLRKSLREQSFIDPLTGVYNRRAIEEWFDREVQGAARSGRTVALLVLDIDHFKRFNDQCGHECGDAALRQLANILRNGLRSEDLICRLGGEEFAVLLPDTTLAEAATVAEKLRSAAATLVTTYHGQAVGPITISIGVAGIGSDGRSVEELLRRADLALYRAKANGRNRVQVSDGDERRDRCLPRSGGVSVCGGP